MAQFDESGNFIGNEISISDIADSGTFIPAGRYRARLASVTGKDSKAGKPMVQAVYEITDGDYEGLELYLHHTMVVFAPKKVGGKAFAPGVAEMKATFAAVGEPLPAGFSLPATTYGDEGLRCVDMNKAAKLYASKLRGKTVELAVYEEVVKNKETKEPQIDPATGKAETTTRSKIIGLLGGGSSATTEGDVL